MPGKELICVASYARDTNTYEPIRCCYAEEMIFSEKCCFLFDDPVPDRSVRLLTKGQRGVRVLHREFVPRCRPRSSCSRMGG